MVMSNRGCFLSRSMDTIVQLIFTNLMTETRDLNKETQTFVYTFLAEVLWLLTSVNHNARETLSFIFVSDVGLLTTNGCSSLDFTDCKQCFTTICHEEIIIDPEFSTKSRCATFENCKRTCSQNFLRSEPRSHFGD